MMAAAGTTTTPTPTPLRGGPARPSTEDVAACIRRHRDGAPTALTDLTRLVTPWLHQVARGFRLPPSTADDVVQATLLAALLHLDELRDPAAGLSWLWTVARREALRVIKMERRYVPVTEPELPSTASAGAGPEEIVLARQSRAAVRRTVALLPPRQRVLLEHLFGADEPDYATISAALDMPTGSIGPTRRRSLERMRRLLSADPGWDTELSA